MLGFIKKRVKNLRSAIQPAVYDKTETLEAQAILSAKQILFTWRLYDLDLLVNSDKFKITDFEFKVFSQFGDDGIIQFLIDYLQIGNKTFIEFGVTDYWESNTRFLLMNNNWKGLVMDGSDQAIQRIKSSYYYWRHDLTADQLWVTKENIDDYIFKNGFSGDIGLLHIDLDGNDYWIWKALACIQPVIFIGEYNSVFGVQPWTVPYDENFDRTKSHFSNLYWGTSLASLIQLGESKGYYCVGTNSAGNNAYFIKKEFIKDLKPLSCEEALVISKYRESRNETGNLNYISGEDRLNQIRGMKVFNTKLMTIETI